MYRVPSGKRFGLAGVCPLQDDGQIVPADAEFSYVRHGLVERDPVINDPYDGVFGALLRHSTSFFQTTTSTESPGISSTPRSVLLPNKGQHTSLA